MLFGTHTPYQNNVGLSPSPAPSNSIQASPYCSPWEGAGDGSSFGSLSPTWETQMEFLAFRFWSDPTPEGVGIWGINEWIK